MKTHQITVTVSTDSDISATEIAVLVARLIDIGVEDAQSTIHHGEGDLYNAELIAEMTFSVTPAN